MAPQLGPLSLAYFAGARVSLSLSERVDVHRGCRRKRGALAMTAFFVPLPEEFNAMAARAAIPLPCLREEWDLGNYLSGSTEPWVVEILAALMKANNAKTVLECGGYLG